MRAVSNRELARVRTGPREFSSMRQPEGCREAFTYARLSWWTLTSPPSEFDGYDL